MLKESTQKRLLQMAGLGQYEEEVLSEMKQIVQKEKMLKESAHSMKKDENEKDTKSKEEKVKEKDKQVKLSEMPQEDLEEGPVGDDVDLGVDNEPTEDLGGKSFDVEGGTDATVDFDAFAAEFVELMSKHAGGARYEITKDGEPLSPVSEGDFGGESELASLHDEPDGDEFDGGTEEMPSEELEEPTIENDPMKESKQVARMFFNKVIEKLKENHLDKKKIKEAKWVPGSGPSWENDPEHNPGGSYGTRVLPGNTHPTDSPEDGRLDKRKQAFKDPKSLFSKDKDFKDATRVDIRGKSSPVVPPLDPPKVAKPLTSRNAPISVDPRHHEGTKTFSGNVPFSTQTSKTGTTGAVERFSSNKEAQNNVVLEPSLEQENPTSNLINKFYDQHFSNKLPQNSKEKLLSFLNEIIPYDDETLDLRSIYSRVNNNPKLDVKEKSVAKAIAMQINKERESQNR